mmetsp:Transcript_11996/g.48333  ORF Transcript_11996/g.48333 Transcript_11996/m.48333 type:complete len:109 (-) Transcript_11996:60-386(-)
MTSFKDWATGMHATWTIPQPGGTNEREHDDFHARISRNAENTELRFELPANGGNYGVRLLRHVVGSRYQEAVERNADGSWTIGKNGKKYYFLINWDGGDKVYQLAFRF